MRVPLCPHQRVLGIIRPRAPHDILVGVVTGQHHLLGHELDCLAMDLELGVQLSQEQVASLEGVMVLAHVLHPVVQHQAVLSRQLDALRGQPCNSAAVQQRSSAAAQQRSSAAGHTTPLLHLADRPWRFCMQGGHGGQKWSCAPTLSCTRACCDSAVAHAHAAIVLCTQPTVHTALAHAHRATARGGSTARSLFRQIPRPPTALLHSKALLHCCCRRL